MTSLASGVLRRCAAALVAVGAAMLITACADAENGWVPREPPKSAELEAARDAAPSPSYWFGPEAPRGDPLSGVSAAGVAYGVSCTESTSGELCTERAWVRSHARGPKLRTLVARRECWHRYRGATVYWCPPKDAEGTSRSLYPRIFSGRRVIGYFAARRGEYGSPPVTVYDDQWSEDWDTFVDALRRFDRAGVRGIAPAARLSCAEYRRVEAPVRRTLPTALRPASSC